MSQFDAICFDLDGTLCQSDQSLAEIHRSTFERAGVEQFLSPDDVRSVPDDDVATAESAPEFYRNLFDAAVARLDDDSDSEHTPDPDEETLWALGEAAAEVVDNRAISWRDGAEGALDYARERYPVGLVTNGGEQTQTTKLAQLGLSEAFDVTVFCDPAGGVEPKPASTPFDIALSSLGVRPERTLYVGNSFSADVVGARVAGLEVVWIPERSDAEPPEGTDVEPTHRLDSPTALPSIL